jgi:hypothetical protein
LKLYLKISIFNIYLLKKNMAKSQDAKKTTKKEPLKTNLVLGVEGFAKVAAEVSNEERADDRKLSVRFTK